MVPWVRMSQPLNGISIGSVVFAQYICVTSVAIGLIYALSACHSAKQVGQIPKLSLLVLLEVHFSSA